MSQKNEVIQSTQQQTTEEAINRNTEGKEVKTYSRQEDAMNNIKERASSDTTIFRGTLMITNLCFGVTIFTFAIRATYFGLVWLIVTGAVVGIITYWSLMCGIIASSKCKEDDYSELTEKILGKKARIFLNVIIIIYSYAVMMMFMALTYSLFGRFIHAAGYTNKYPDYDDFDKEIWTKAYIKFPVYIGLTLGLCFMCLIKDIDKLNFSAYIGVFAVIYSLIIVLVQCHDYYKDSKKNIILKKIKAPILIGLILEKPFQKN